MKNLYIETSESTETSEPYTTCELSECIEPSESIFWGDFFPNGSGAGGLRILDKKKKMICFGESSEPSDSSHSSDTETLLCYSTSKESHCCRNS